MLVGFSRGGLCAQWVLRLPGGGGPVRGAGPDDGRGCPPRPVPRREGQGYPVRNVRIYVHMIADGTALITKAFFLM